MTSRRRNLILGGIALVCFAVAGYVFVATGSSRGPAPGEYIEHCICLACQQEVVLRHGADEIAPYRCPHCGQAAVYSWYYCYDCGKRFVPKPLMREPGGPLRPPATVICGACGSRNVCAYVPELLSEEPKGNAPLPKWSP